MSELENRPKPFSKDRFKVTACKLIFFYSVFYVVMKITAVFNDYPVKASLIISAPFLLLSLWGGLVVKKHTYNWLYVIVGVIVISLIRYYELKIFNYIILE